MRTESTQNIINFESVKPINPIAPYLGGKRLLAKTIVPIIEQIPHTFYIKEVQTTYTVGTHPGKKANELLIGNINFDTL